MTAKRHNRWIHSHTKAQGSLLKRLWRPEDKGVCCETVSLSNVRSSIHRVSPARLPDLELNKASNDKHARWTEKKSQGFNPTQRTPGNQRMMGGGDVAFLQGKAHQLIWYQMVNPEIIHIVTYRLNRLYLETYKSVCVRVCVHTGNNN